MQTTKRYTNQTFTKRVDDEAGRHRTLRSLPEPAVCEVCGDVYVQGKFFESHRDEIKRLLENEAERTAEGNPMARIMEWQADPDGKLTVTTTTEHLAQRLGHALHKAYHGKVRYGFSHRNKLARVWWQQD